MAITDGDKVKYTPRNNCKVGHKKYCTKKATTENEYGTPMCQPCLVWIEVREEKPLPLVTYTEDNIGDEVSIRYPHGTLVDTIVVENTCIVCGQSYIGIKEEVAHLLAQHSIIHTNEAEQIHMSIVHLDGGERRQLFESHITGMAHIFEEHPPMRNKVLVALQICLSRFASIQLVNNGDE